MSAHMRRHHIKDEDHESADDENFSWREVFRDGIAELTEIGLLLKGGRYKAGLTQKDLAKKIGVLPHHISEMEHGKRPIGKKMAQKLAKIFNIDYRIFL